MPLFVLLAACTSSPSEPSLADAFAQAAEEHDVPRDLLVAIAWSATRVEEPRAGAHEHGGVRGYGLMDLGAGSPESGPDLARGAARLGVDVEDTLRDPAANIAVAAAELRWKADQLTEQGAPAIVRIEDWVEVVGWYSGNTDGGAQRSYARQVYGWIERGIHTRDWLGDGWIVVEPREVDVPMLDLAPIALGAADSRLVENTVPAASCNYSSGSRGSATIDTIVVHTAQGSYSGTYNWFQDCDASASAHYVIRSSDGEITQMVAERDTAWHAGDSGTNSRSVSIELEGYIESPTRWYTDALYGSLASLIADIATRQGVTLDRDHVIGHMEVPGCAYEGGGGRNCHTDPGTGFDWNRLSTVLGGGTAPETDTSEESEASRSAGDVVGFVRVGSIYADDAPIVGATVRAASGATTTTDSRGYFDLSDVPAGAATLTVSASGYTTVTDTVDVIAGASTWNSVALERSGGGSSTTTGPVPPSNLDPTAGELVRGESVTLSWTSTGATSYEVRIYWWDGSDWNTYTSYTTTAAAKTFWPVRDAQYAFMVRAVSGRTSSEWSAISYFRFDG